MHISIPVSKHHPRHARATESDRAAGHRLRQLRLLRGHSQSQIAQALGVSFQAVQKYESGENRLSAGRIATLAQYFRVSVMEFFADASGIGLHPGISSSALALAGSIERLSPRHQATVRTLVEQLGAP
jgi:transcriptional regulator with XRE-family HTH domain